MSYRKARGIELHDRRIAIFAKGEDYASTVFPSLIEFGEYTLLEIEHDDLIKVFNALGLGDPVRQSPGHLTVKTSYTPYDGSLSEVEVEVLSAQLINVRVLEEFEEDGVIINEPYEFTYSGSFTVFWDKESIENTSD